MAKFTSKTQTKEAAILASSAGEGVRGESTFAGAGVSGSSNEGAGVSGSSKGGPGVFGQGFKDAGVLGLHGNPHLEETTVSNHGAKAGLFGASDIGGGVVGYSRDPQSFGVIAFGGIRVAAMNHPFAGEFNGAVQVEGDLTVTGDVFLPGADCAEHFEVANSEPIEPGSVVIIGEGGGLMQSRHAYDKRVAGVVSGAGNYRPGIILDSQNGAKERLALALTGKVYCKVDAQYAAIEIGDLLTSSPTPGFAMKVSDPLRAFGTVIGKALRPQTTGQGLIPILVALQ